ncbi:MAG: hypothetical protein RR314_01930 [Oscillospiraceae bacterium]
MKFFQNRAVAVLIAIAVVCGSALVNTQVKLGEASRRVEDSFFVSGDSAPRSPYARLDERLNASNGLWSILVKYDADAAALLSDVRGTLLSAYESRDISDMYDANKELQTAFQTAEAALAAYTLNDTEQSALSDYQTSFSGAQKMIDRSEYNSTVLDFMRGTYDKFPASLLASVTGVDAPELFE